jgi:hypothetical protein
MASPIIERVKAHRDALGRKMIEVEEWPDESGQPTVIYSKPITLGELRRWYKGINGDDISVLVDVIIAKAENDDGERLFTLEDKQPLLRIAEFSVVSRIAGEMMDHSDDLDEIEKN